VHVSEGSAPERTRDLPPTDTEQAEITARERDLKVLRVVGHREQADLE